eukprot:5496592-Alexandrium_andersonii.AAC.1
MRSSAGVRAPAIATTPTVAMPVREPLTMGPGKVPLRAWRCGGTAKAGSRKAPEGVSGHGLGDA